MIRYFRRTLLDALRRNTLLYALTLLGTALGVASVVAIRMINLNAIGAFEASVEAGAAGAQLQVLPLSGALTEEALVTVLQTEGVVRAWPIVEGQLRLEGGGRLDLIGLDLAAPPGSPAGLLDDPATALQTPGWVALTEAAARRLNWKKGDRVDAWLGTRRRSLLVGQILDASTSALVGPGVDAITDIAAAQDMFGIRNGLQRIGVRTGDNEAAVTERLSTRLDGVARVVTPGQRLDGARRLLQAFRLNLTALSYISLLVGVFLIYSSIQASLVRRRAEFGVLRSTGATRGQVLGLILAEALLIGAGGVALGLPVGFAAARQSLGMVNATLTNIYLVRAIEELTLPVSIYLQGAAVGLAAAAAGALLPALDMSRRSPRSLLSHITLERRVSGWAPVLFGAGSVAAAAALLWYWLGGSGWQPAGFVLGAAVLVALPLQIPLVMQQLCRWVPARGFGIGFSIRSLAARLTTTSFAVSALAVAVSMLVGMTVLVGSFRATVRQWIQATIVADIYVSSPPLSGAAAAAGLDSDLVSRLESMEAVVASDRLRAGTIFVKDRPVRITGVALAQGRGERRYPLREARPGAYRAVLSGEGVLISEPLAQRLQLGVADWLTLTATGSRIRLPIAGITYDYSNDSGTIVTSLERYEAIFGAGQLDSLALYLAPDASLEQALGAVGDQARPGGAFVTASWAIRRRALELFDQTFAIVRLLQLMSLLIAVAGITLTLLILARERSGEIALYRALGALRGQVLRFFIGKGLGLGLFGLAAGSVGGALLAAILVVVINRSFFGWTIAIDIPWATLAVQAAVLLGAAAAAAFFPALRASRVPATELSHDDV